MTYYTLTYLCVVCERKGEEDYFLSYLKILIDNKLMTELS